MNISVLIERESDSVWLRYILELFTTVTHSEISYELTTSDKGLYPIVIAYGRMIKTEKHYVVSIPRIQEFSPRQYTLLNVDNLDDDRLTGTSIPVYSKTILSSDSTAHNDSLSCVKINGNNITLSFDILYNCFIRLSCLEEWNYEEKNGAVHSYINKIKGSEIQHSKPFVNYLFTILEKTLEILGKKAGNSVMFIRPQGFTVCLTHDVDYIRKTSSLRLKRFGFYLLNGLFHMKVLNLKAMYSDIIKSFNFLLSPSDYWQFENIRDMEKTYNYVSTFYFYAGTNKGNITDRIMQFFFDPGYKVASNIRLKNNIRELVQAGWEVGLHGSSKSYDSLELLRKEKIRLESISGHPVKTTRQHWLHFSLRDTWRIQEDTGIGGDTTLGYNDCLGFRSGIANAYHPYDIINHQKHQIIEVPMVLMDGTLFDHCMMNKEEARQKSLAILEEVKKFHGCVAINWHQRTASSDYKWYWLYEELLNWVQENGGRGIPLDECVENLSKHETVL